MDGNLEITLDDPRDHDAAGRGLYANVIRAVVETPWAILPSTLAVIQDLLAYRSAGYRLNSRQIEARLESAGPRDMRAAGRGTTATRGGVAVLPVYGVIAPRAAQFADVSSPNGTGCDRLTAMFRQAMDDPAVGSIVFEHDSPGGQVGGLPELAAEIRNARGGDKPIVAIANGLCASAAYWLGSQCDEFVITPSGEAGSIGVWAAHKDISAALEMDGVKVTLISAGRYKVEGNPFEALSEEAAAAIQADVDAYYEMFKKEVALGRGVPLSRVSDGFGEGRTLMAKQAVTEGLADRVATFDETIARLGRGGTRSRKPAAAAAAASDVSRLNDDGAPFVAGENALEPALLDLQPGDRLVLSAPGPLTSDQTAVLRAQLEERFPDHEATILSDGMTLSVSRERADSEPVDTPDEDSGGTAAGEDDTPSSALEPAEHAARLMSRPAFREAAREFLNHEGGE